MAYKVGDKVMVDGEECEVLLVYGEGTGYMVETPDGITKKVIAELVSEVEGEKEPEPEPEPELEPEPKPEGEGEGEGEGKPEED